LFVVTSSANRSNSASSDGLFANNSSYSGSFTIPFTFADISAQFVVFTTALLSFSTLLQIAFFVSEIDSISSREFFGFLPCFTTSFTHCKSFSS
jgi:hypothetical protein